MHEPRRAAGDVWGFPTDNRYCLDESTGHPYTSVVPIEWDKNDPPWDPKKRESNLRKWCLDFVDAGQVFEDDYYIEELQPNSLEEHGEERWLVIGLVHGQLLRVVYTERDGKARYITARKATARERKTYEEAYKKGPG